MDRLKALTVGNFRSLAHVRFELSEFQVLIGENGGGKSSLVECFEILRLTTDSTTNFQTALENLHGGSLAMIRWGETQATINAEIELAGVGLFTYSVGFGGQPGQPVRLLLEQLVQEGVETVYRRSNGTYATPVRRGAEWPGSVPPRMNVAVDATETALRFGRHDEHISRVCDVIMGIEAHLGFETQALWRTRERLGNSGQIIGGIREPGLLQQVQRLEHGGGNLASVIWSLKNSARWKRFLDIVRLGLGNTIGDLELHATGRNTIEINLRFDDGRRVAAASLSDGQLNWLCLVAMVMATERRSLLIVDEPELHLHPSLAVRALDLLESTVENHPVVIATHSDAILDALEKPQEDVRVVSAKEGQTRLERLNQEFLKQWQPQSLSELRAARGDQGLIEP